MRVRVVSDLHIDKHPDGGKTAVEMTMEDDGYDVLVVAGDLCDGPYLKKGISLVARAAAGRPVIYVLGNHDHWRSGIDTGVASAKHCSKDFKDFHILDREVVEIKGQRFVGSTNWYRLPRISNIDAEYIDFQRIRGLRSKIVKRAIESANFLESEVRNGDVVVTHILPHVRSIHARYSDAPSNKFFLHDMSRVLERNGARMWIHGHTHSSFDYRIGKTRVICNPLGYMTIDGFENPRFDPALTFELS